MDVVSQVRSIFLEVCKNSKNCKEDYEIHTGIVERLALKLAERFKADKKVVELSALLHDIGRIKHDTGKDQLQHAQRDHRTQARHQTP